MHFRVKDKRNRVHFVPVHPMAQRLIEEYSMVAKHGGGLDGLDLDGPLFRPAAAGTGTLDKHLDPGSVYRNIVSKYGQATGINTE